MTKELRTALDDCMGRLTAGESIEACLERYPTLAAKLQPLLDAAISLRRFQVEPYSQAAFQAGKARLRAAVTERRVQAGSERRLPSWVPPRPVAVLAAAVAVAAVFAFLFVATDMFGLRASPTQAVEGVVESVDLENDIWRISTSSMGTIEIRYGPNTPILDAQGRHLDPHDIMPGTRVRIELGEDGDTWAERVHVESDNSGPGGGGTGDNSGPGGGDGGGAGDNSGPGGGGTSGPGGPGPTATTAAEATPEPSVEPTAEDSGGPDSGGSSGPGSDGAGSDSSGSGSGQDN